MKEFTNLDAFTKHLDQVTKQYSQRERKALEVIGDAVERKSKENIGHLQQGAGGFKPWEPLAESTKKDKERQGYVYNSDYNPLYRTGDLRESIHHVVNLGEHKVVIGSDSEIAAYQELGTQHIPARSFLGLALFTEKQKIIYILGLFLQYWITNNRSALRIV